MIKLLVLAFITCSCQNPFGEDTVVSVNNPQGTKSNAKAIITGNIDLTFEANSTKELDISLSDSDDPLKCSDITIETSDSTLISSAEIVITGIAPNCKLKFSPKLNIVGEATVQLSVSDTKDTTTVTMKITTTFIPSVISNITSWYDPKDTDTLFTDSSCTNAANNGDPIGCMKDKSSTTAKATANGADRPSVQNGALKFVGDANGNVNGHCFNISPMNARTIIMVIDNAQNGTGGIHGLLGGPSGKYLFLSTAQGYGISFDGSGSDTGKYSINDGTFSTVDEDAGGSNINSDLQLISMEYTTYQSGWISLGCFDNGGAQLRYRPNFDLYDFITFDRVLTSSELLKVQNFLNEKHSIY
jgi:hypothetical protein